MPLLQAILAGDPIGDIRVSAAMALGSIGTDEAHAALKAGCAVPPPADEPQVEIACAKAEKLFAAVR